MVSDTYARNPYAINDQPRDIIQKPDFVSRNILIDKGISYSNRGDGYSEGVELFLKNQINQEKQDYLVGFLILIRLQKEIIIRLDYQILNREIEI